MRSFPRMQPGVRLLCLMLLAAPACQSRHAGSPAKGALPVVKIEDRVITTTDWQRFRSAKLRLDEHQDESELFNLFVDHEILLHVAERDRTYVDDEDVRENLLKLGMTTSTDLANPELIRAVRDDLRVQKWIKSNISAAVQVRLDEAETYFELNQLQFLQPETVHVREILVADEVLAQRLHRQLQRQPVEAFIQAARKFSRAPSASRNGEVGTFKQGDLPEAFESAVFRLRAGQISAPVKSDLGYHLFLVDERIRSHRQKFFEVKDQIFEKLLADKESSAIQTRIGDLKKRLNVRVYPENLKST